jgi:hypothetical protein
MHGNIHGAPLKHASHGTRCTIERHNGWPVRPARKMRRSHLRQACDGFYLPRDGGSNRPDVPPVGSSSPQEDQDARAAERAKYLKHTVYYVKIGELLKIGYTSNMRLRMLRYPPNRWVMATEDGDSLLEQKRHRQFADLRTHGNEWYRLDEPLLTHINDLRRASGAPPVDLRVSS